MCQTVYDGRVESPTVTTHSTELIFVCCLLGWDFTNLCWWFVKIVPFVYEEIMSFTQKCIMFYWCDFVIATVSAIFLTWCCMCQKVYDDSKIAHRDQAMHRVAALSAFFFFNLMVDVSNSLWWQGKITRNDHKFRVATLSAIFVTQCMCQTVYDDRIKSPTMIILSRIATLSVIFVT